MAVSPLLLAAFLPTIWIVDAANGPGTNFTSLPAAVAAASSGDTLIVRQGTYATFTVGGKALTMRGAGTGATIVMAAASWNQTVISGVPPGQSFYVSGMAFVPTP